MPAKRLGLGGGVYGIVARCVKSVVIDILYKHCYNSAAMSPKKFTAFRIDDRLLKAMQGVRDAEGLSVTTQVELAVREWLKKRGVVVKTERKRAVTRLRP